MIKLRLGDTGAARLGHELFHVQEIVETGKSLEEREAAREKGVKRSGSNQTGFESTAAQDFEAKIKKEIAEAKKRARQQRTAFRGLDTLRSGAAFFLPYY